MAFSRFLDPKNDYLFKRLFGKEQNKDILIYFINSILNLTGERAVQDVTYLRPDQNPEYGYKKESMVDVLCRDQTGTQFIIQIKVAKFSEFEERAQVYATNAYVNQMNVGGKYEKLKEVIFIALTEYVKFPDKPDWKSERVTLDKKRFEKDLKYLKEFSFTYIELPKFKKTINELTTTEEKWVYFFKHAHETLEKDVETYLGDDVVLKKAFYESTKFSMSEQEWNSYESALKNERDAKAIEDYNIEQGKIEGRIEGLAEGEAKGEKAAKIEIAQGMLAKKMDVKLIAELTGLTVIEINELK